MRCIYFYDVVTCDSTPQDKCCKKLYVYMDEKDWAK